MNRIVPFFACAFVVAGLQVTGHAATTENDAETTATESRERAASEETGQEETGSQAEDQKQREDREDSASDGTNRPNGFVPSEEISQDLSVSFPVDI